MSAPFEISAAMLVFVCVMVFIAGFVDASAGGGGIISLPAYFFTGMPAHFALGCNKFSSSCGTTVSAFKFWRSGAADLGTGLIAAAGSFAGSAAGSSLTLHISDSVLRMMMIVILPCAAAVIFLKRDFGENSSQHSLPRLRAAVLALMIGMMIGAYDGLFGPGTGTFAIIAFSIIMKYDIRTASGNAKLLNLASNYASLLTFAVAGTINYKIAVPCALCGIAGNYFGARCALSRGARFIRPMMLIVLALLMMRIIYDLISQI